jgi:hypothetical protein
MRDRNVVVHPTRLERAEDPSKRALPHRQVTLR